jgi:uncharacterized protein (DUF1015 family)
MALIKPFAALRPQPRLADKICELPYDVTSTEEARALAAGNPLSFLHVSKPEIDLPSGVDVHSPQVYARGRENLDRLISQGALRQDAHPSFYFYRQTLGRHEQTGLAAAASCEDYLRGVIKKHELTRPEQEDDRMRHIETLGWQTGPVFLAYRANRLLDELAAKHTAQAPDTDFTARDGIRHASWPLRDAGDIALVRRTFADIPSLYIADGHHRCAAAARVFQARGGAGGSASFLSVIFPDHQLRILPYNRVLKDFNGLNAAQLLKKLEAVFEVMDGGAARPGGKHELALFLDNRWRALRFRPQFSAVTGPVEGLDVALLQKHVLGPVFGIDDPRTSGRVGFVGGIRGTEELEKLVRGGGYACAFSMFPASLADMMSIADAGGIMPPKSTWFEPKLRDAMFCHKI